jgi:TatD DNase family protein
MPEFYDTHAHLDSPRFTNDLDEVIARAEAAGITRVITVGTDFQSSARAIELSRQYAAVYAAVGWHPTAALQAPADLRPTLRQLAQHPKVVALGETGLDYHHLPSRESRGATAAADQRYKQRQTLLFHQHLEVAAELGLGCVVHSRNSLQEVLAQMRPFAGQVRGVLHCFVDDAAAMGQVLEAGSLVSFTGVVTYQSGAAAREALGAAPPGKFMLETDCPYLAPCPNRRRRCEPACVQEIARVAAAVRGVSLAELSVATCAAAREFFGKLR